MFESLIPKPILQRYVSLLMEHRRIILSGPSGTGKTYLANRLSEYMVLREGRELTDGVIATFNVDHKSSKVRKWRLSLLKERIHYWDVKTPFVFWSSVNAISNVLYQGCSISSSQPKSSHQGPVIHPAGLPIGLEIWHQGRGGIVNCHSSWSGSGSYGN